MTTNVSGPGGAAPTSEASTSNFAGTEVSVLTMTQTSVPSSSKNGARGRVYCPRMDAVALEVALGAVVLGEYLAA